MKLPPDAIAEFTAAVRAASGRAEVCRAVGNVYAAVGDAVALRRPVCVASGRCCRFDEFGHRLYVTTLEMAAFVHDLPAPIGAIPAGGCPFQAEKLCGVHAIRPFGCRIFFCDATAGDWQQEQYAAFHRELKRLHEELGVQYFYVEWREALAALRDLAVGDGA